MKNVITIFQVFVLSFNWLCAQSFNKIETVNGINWYGFNFTKTRLIGSRDFRNTSLICHRYIHHEWNRKLEVEQKKYNVAKAFGNKPIDFFFQISNNMNLQVKEDSLVTDENYFLTTSQIQEIINEYPGQVNGKVGLVFIVESFDKRIPAGVFWVTFFDESTKRVIYTKKYYGKPQGNGLLNYWLNSANPVIKQCKRDFKMWR